LFFAFVFVFFIFKIIVTQNWPHLKPVIHRKDFLLEIFLSARFGRDFARYAEFIYLKY
jgi:hypothetical protein